MDGKRKSAKKDIVDNNNLSRIEEDAASASGSNECDEEENESFVERFLTVANMTFTILPNGGTGDCLFKAISQAIFEGDESEHLPIRQQIVAFIAEKTWEKYQVSIQVQHINGHNNLQKSWDENPIAAYKHYMLDEGTLGSFLELNAAGELYQFNFASIQEYNDSVGTTYRVENSRQFPNKRVPMQYFLFTGDFDNGHWEYMKPEKRRSELADGTYSNGTLDIVIDGQVSSVEFWLMENTQIGQIEYDDVSQAIYLRKRSKYPFDCQLLRFESDKTVELIDVSFVITPSKYSDLFSVLANSHLRNESLAKEMHDLLTTYRNSNFSSLNYKLITQPHSHGFTTGVLKYASLAYKGNIQDLLSAADLYGFSFTIYLIIQNVIHLCKFIHVDRWGGEVSTMEYFFINMVPSLLSNRTKVCAHWYHLVPMSSNAEKHTNSVNLLKNIKSVREIDCEELAAAINLENKKYIKDKAKNLYNLYFDRQLNPISDDGGDSSVKPSLQDSENNHTKEPQPKVGKKPLETKIIEGSSHLIEMKPNVVYRYDSVDSNFPSNQKLPTNGENSNQIDQNKSHYLMRKVSSHDLRMTPSTLLYARPSFIFNGLHKKTSQPFENLDVESKSQNGNQETKPEISSKSIAESIAYNKIILEHTINSTSVSSASSIKSALCDNVCEINSNGDVSDTESKVEDAGKVEEVNRVPSVLSNRTEASSHRHPLPIKAWSYNPSAKHNSSYTLMKHDKYVRQIGSEEQSTATGIESKKYRKKNTKELHDLHSDGQRNPLIDDEGNCSVKPNCKESKCIRAKKSPQKLRKKSLETTIINENSHLIEMKPNVIYRYDGSIDSKTPLDIIQPNNSENANQINDSKISNSMKKVVNHKDSLTLLKNQKSVRQIDCEEPIANISIKKNKKNKVKELRQLDYDCPHNDSEEDGDSLVKPSLQESEHILTKESLQKFRNKPSERTIIIEQNSDPIEIKPNTFNTHGSIDSLHQKQSTNGEYSNQNDSDKCCYSMDKESNLILKVTPSLVDARSSIDFIGVDKKTSENIQSFEMKSKSADKKNNDSRETTPELSKVVTSSRSILKSATRNKIILENKNSASASSVDSVKSSCNNRSVKISSHEDSDRNSSIEEITIRNIRESVQERIRRESMEGNFESLQSLRSNTTTVSYYDRESVKSRRKGYLNRVCKAIGSICSSKR